MELKKNRDETFDVVKAIGIILIVWGHAGLPASNYIYLFHVPVFFIISGFFFKDSYLLDFKHFFVRKFKELYLPFIFIEIIFIICHNLFIRMGFYNETQTFCSLYSVSSIVRALLDTLLFNGSELLLAPLWFVTILFWTSILFFILLKIFSSIMNYVSIIILVFLVFLTSVIFFEFSQIEEFKLLNFKLNYTSIDVIYTSLAFFCLGYIFNFYDLKSKITSYTVPFAIILFIIIAKTNYQSVDTRINKFPNLGFILTTGCLGYFILVYISKIIMKLIIKKIFVFIGENTFIIMALHLLCFKIISYVQIVKFNSSSESLASFTINDTSIYWKLLYLMVGLIIPIVLSFCGKKILRTMKNLQSEFYGNKLLS